MGAAGTFALTFAALFTGAALYMNVDRPLGAYQWMHVIPRGRLHPMAGGIDAIAFGGAHVIWMLIAGVAALADRATRCG